MTCQKGSLKYIKNSDGYSLLELMIVVGIIGILAASATFNYTSENSNQRRASLDLYANMQLVKSEAIESNSSRVIKFNWPANGQYSVCTNDDNSTATDTVGGWIDGDEVCEPSVTLTNYHAGISFGFGNALSAANGDNCTIPGNCADPVTYANDVMRIDSRGLASTTGYVYIQNSKNNCLAVGIPSRAGVIVIRKWECIAWNVDGTCSNGQWN